MEGNSLTTECTGTTELVGVIRRMGEIYPLLGGSRLVLSSDATQTADKVEGYFWVISPYIDIPLFVVFALIVIFLIYQCIIARDRATAYFLDGPEDGVSVQLSTLDDDHPSE